MIRPCARALLLILWLESLVPSAAMASPLGGVSLGNEVSGAGSGSEYVSGNYPGAILMQVNLWGGVSKPGIHHIPSGTDLVTLLSLAGGPSSDADLSSVTIKRRGPAGEEILEVNVEKILNRGGTRSPQLEAQDIIVIPRERPALSNNTVATVSFVGSVLGIILAGIALTNQIQK